MRNMYELDIVHQNLSKEETIVQIADNLKYLSQIANDIFKRIDNRIKINSKTINNISNRITAASNKVEALSGDKKATQVFSSCKYPASDTNHTYKSIFSDNIKLPFIRTKVAGKHIQNKDEPLEKLKFYHVKVRNILDKGNLEGLGGIPNDVRFINDILLYNTGKNLYKNYVMSDTLKISQKSKQQESISQLNIVDAPYSISERTALTKSVTDSFFYSPDLGDVPLLDVPLDLPDLPGIANDLRYINEPGPVIAPSVSTTPNMPDLPPIFQDVAGNTQLDPEEIVPEIIPVLLDTTTIIKEEKPQTHFEVKSPQPLENTEKTLPVIGDIHANLMDAIRRAGGSKTLKASKPKQTEKSTITGNDLMADLHAKLSLRRKGISGTKQQDDGFDSNTAMNKISAMIPPPPSNNDHSESTNTEDDDWD